MYKPTVFGPSVFPKQKFFFTKKRFAVDDHNPFCLIGFCFIIVLPAHTNVDQQRVKLLSYTGKAQNFFIKSERLVAVMPTKKLYQSVQGSKAQPNEPARLPNWSSISEKKKHKAVKGVYARTGAAHKASGLKKPLHP